jgi:hypothetical protein
MSSLDVVVPADSQLTPRRNPGRAIVCRWRLALDVVEH